LGRFDQTRTFQFPPYLVELGFRTDSVEAIYIMQNFIPLPLCCLETFGENGGTFSRFLRPLDEMEMEVKAKKAIDSLEVRTLKSVRTKVGALSGGQRQAIAIARAVGTESTIVLLDEPTAALGVAQTRQVLDAVKRLRDTNHAVVYVSHNLRDVFEIADRICVLRQGGNVATWKAAQTNPDEIVAAMTRGLDSESGSAL